MSPMSSGEARLAYFKANQTMPHDFTPHPQDNQCDRCGLGLKAHVRQAVLL